MEEAKADRCEGQVERGGDDGGVAVIADSHDTQSLDPAEGPFDRPAVTAQMRTVWAVAVTNGGVDAAADNASRVAWLSYPASAKSRSGDRRGRPGWPPIAGYAATVGRISR